MSIDDHMVAFTEAQAFAACSGVIDEYEEERPLTENRINFAKAMFSLLSPENARIVIEYYPFRDIIAKYDILTW